MKRALLVIALASIPMTATAQLSADAAGPHSPVIRPVAATVPAAAQHIVQFWLDAGRKLWFAKDAEFDDLFRAHFAAEYEAAARGELDAWLESADGALALMVLLDQYPRNSFRGSARMYATDDAALRYAEAAIAKGHDRTVPPELQMFFYLPFAHSERLADQDRSVALCARLDQTTLARAEHHRDIVRRFGRFPHRNLILGRAMTPEEQAYLDNGGFSG